MWSEMEKQNVQAEKVYCIQSYRKLQMRDKQEKENAYISISYNYKKIERKETRRKKLWCSIRFVITKVHRAEGTFLENKILFLSLGGSAM